jgi:hypothetical protein
MRARESIKEVEEGSWTYCGTKKRQGRAGAAAGGRRHAWWLWVTVARLGGAGKSQQGSGERRAGELAAREIAGKGRQAVQQSSREEGERGRLRGLVQNFSKVPGVHCEVIFSFKP